MPHMADTFRYQRPPQILDFVAFMGAGPHFMGTRLKTVSKLFVVHHAETAHGT